MAVTAAAAAVSFGVAGCDSSPVAANVDGALIKQAALRTQMRELASSPEFVQAWDSQQSAPTIQGDAPGTFSLFFSAWVLDSMIVGSALNQHLAAMHRQIDPSIEAAVRGVLELGSAGWFQFSPALRDRLVELDSATVAVQPPVPDDSLAQQFLLQPDKQAYFFTNVCVRTISVTVPNGAGGVDYPASLSRAQQIQDQFSGTAGSSAAPGGSSSATTSSSTTSSGGSSSSSSTTASTIGGAAGATPSTTTAGGSTGPTTSTTTGGTTSTTAAAGPSGPTTTTDAGSPSSSTTAPSTSTTTPQPGGSVQCYSPAQLEAQGEGFFNTVLGLAPGQAAAPQRTSYGYQVIAIDSRQLLDFNAGVGKALSYLEPNLATVSPRDAIDRVLATTPVYVNPLIGRWEAHSPDGPTIAGPRLPTDIDPNLGFSLQQSDGQQQAGG